MSDLTYALIQWRSRKPFPTDFASVDLRGLSRELMQRSVVTARCTNANYLQEIAETVDDLLAGKIGMADGRLRLFRKLKELGYDPLSGFPDEMGVIPPAERDSIRDHSSEARLNLILETNVRMAQSYGQLVEGNGEYALHAYPAWELVRFYPRVVERGAPKSHTVGWFDRWRDAGESVNWEGAVELPMVALKSSPIWEALGEGAGGYEDTINNPYPPFAFNSGMAWRPVSRARCIELDLITDSSSSSPSPFSSLAPTRDEFSDVLEYLSPDLRAELERELSYDMNARAEAGTRRMGEFWQRARAEFDGGAIPLVNSGSSEGAERGWETRRTGIPHHAPGSAGRRHLTQKEKRMIRDAQAEARKVVRQKGRYDGSIEVPGEGRVRITYGDPGSWAGADGMGLSKIDRKHGDKALLQIPHVLLRGKRGPWKPDPESPGLTKREYRMGRLLVVISKRMSGRGGGPAVLTSFDPDAKILKKGDRNP